MAIIEHEIENPVYPVHPCHYELKGIYIMGFRNNAYRSLMTGNAQPRHHTSWLDAMDDAMESYLQES